VPPPQIMFIGIRGAGVQTQMKKLSECYHIPILDLKKNLLELLESEK